MQRHHFRIVLIENLFRTLIRKQVRKQLTQTIVNTTLTIALAPLIAISFIATTAKANVVGGDAQNFNPTTNGLDFVTVQSSETLKPGIINLGLFLNHAVNSLPNFDSTNGNRVSFSDSLTFLDFNAGIGLTDNWDFGLSLPQVLRQQVSDTSGSRAEFASTGMTEFRLNTKYRFFGDDQGGLAAILSTNFNLISNNPFAGTDAGPTVNLELAADTTVQRFALGGNVGYRLRAKGRKIPGSIADPLGNQFVASVAASYHFPAYSTKLISEIFGALPAGSSNSFGERSLSSFEWLLGAKYDVNTNLALHAGGGTELLQGVASPDWRVYIGLNYAFGPIFSSEPSDDPPASTKPRTRYFETVASKNETSIQERLRTQSILFAFDSDEMLGNYDAVLSEMSDSLSRGFKRLQIEGHTDSVGPDAYNRALSLKRANAIKRRLVSRFNQPASKITAVGLGESQPIADNGNYQGRQANRRVEFEIAR